jgi:NADPH:quinone reductase-like Zn-dependent oxidoreductase
MKAFAVSKFGSRKIAAIDIPEPTVGRNDVLVDIKAASINPLDLMLANGEFKQLLKYRLPLVLGHDLSGVVIEVGEKVEDFKVGDEVYSRPRDFRIGTFTERISVNQSDLARKPTSLSHAEAASLPLVGLAAFQALTEVAQIRAGQKVLIHGGAGALGATTIQIAKHLGAYVATTVRTQDVDLVKQLGADQVIDFTKEDFSQILSGYDAVIDALGPKSVLKSLEVLKAGGVVIGFTGPPDSNFAVQLGQSFLKPVMALLSLKVRERAKKLGVRYSFFFMKANGQQLNAITELVNNGALRPHIDKTFDFNETDLAFDYVAQGKAKGKVVTTRS